MWSNLCQAGNSLGGGRIFGYISGCNAAMIKDDVTQGDLAAKGFQPAVGEIAYELGDDFFAWPRGLLKASCPSEKLSAHGPIRFSWRAAG